MATHSSQLPSPSPSSFLFLLLSLLNITMSSISPAYYDPYNNVSYLELNKRRYGEIERHESEKLENRTRRPSIRKIYLKKNGDSKKNKAKKFIWKKWASPTLKLLVEDAGNFVGMGKEAKFLYDKSGYRIRDEEEIRDGETYYLTAGEQFEIFDGDFDTAHSPRNHSRQSYQYNKAPKNGYIPPSRKNSLRRESRSVNNHRRSSWWSTTSEDLIDYDYDKYDYRTPSPTKYRSRSAASLYDTDHHYSDIPRPISTSHHRQHYPLSADVNGRDSTYRHYNYGGRSPSPRKETRKNYPKSGLPLSAPAVKREKSRRRASILEPRIESRRDVPTRHTFPLESRGRSRALSSKSAIVNLSSDFDHHDASRKDKEALKQHKEMMQAWKRSKSGVIYNRRDQTHPDAYLIYVFLNGQGMNCQHIHFQKNQLEKGMHYVLELVARRFNVNPAKLCDLDGKKIHEIQDLMSRGAYVLVPVGQKFRDQWYFLPDNAIDTRDLKIPCLYDINEPICKNVDRVRERSAQRDRLLQRREKKAKSVAGRKKYDVTRSKSMDLTRGPSRKSLY
ncbi:hypothetical protein PRIPAC_74879 [Pristionchus pacificus]|uniref:Doublecortin domain-containing protein n=1 Tax=Pristionchus pacificus TaxID=54126 RepID=A0A2A6BF40_PRIPA|nr:hypothetical protein PRIPAC_74879 [Pristionchus pacificus]|eukprot:PDM64499.1 hypothetical protein PRIPAC_52755 [Pristionchus pacificus]